MVKIPTKKEWRKQSKNSNLQANQVDIMWKESYTRQSQSYDRARWSNWTDKFAAERVENILIKLVNGNDSTKILDVATGTGRASLALAREGGKVIGVDISEAMLEKAQQKVKETGLSNVCLGTANARALPFKDNSFDFIVSLRFFHLMPNHLRRTIMEEMLRVLKPKGLLILEFVNPFFGLGIGTIYRRYFCNFNAIYLWPNQIKDLFAGTKIIGKVGKVFPLASRISKINMKFAKALNCLCGYFPFNQIAAEVWYICRNEKATHLKKRAKSYGLS